MSKTVARLFVIGDLLAWLGILLCAMSFIATLYLVFEDTGVINLRDDPAYIVTESILNAMIAFACWLYIRRKVIWLPVFVLGFLGFAVLSKSIISVGMMLPLVLILGLPWIMGISEVRRDASET